MKILIIGGSGHVSGAVTQIALAHNHEVWTITRGKRPLPKGVISLIADRHDHNAMKMIINEQDMVWDLVVDCICYDLCDIRQDIELFRQHASQFVLVSTDFVYAPTLRKFPQPEEADHFVTPDTGSAYGWKKRLCEEELINSDSGKMAWTIVRPCHIYGPTSELGCMPLHGRDPNLIESLRAGKSLQLVGGGHFLQQPILADDLAETIVSIAGNKNVCHKIFNLAGPDVIESWQYYQIIAELLDVKLTVEEIPVERYLNEHPEHASFICHRIYDISPIRRAGLSVPSTSIKEGLRIHVKGLLERETGGSVCG